MVRFAQFLSMSSTPAPPSQPPGAPAASRPWWTGLLARLKSLTGTRQPPAPHGQAEATLERARWLDSLLHSTPQGFWFIDLEGRTLDLNPAMAGLLGRERHAVLGQLETAFVDEESRARMQQERARRRVGEGSAYDATLLRPDGTRLQCLNTVSPIHDAQGRITGSVGIWTDISRRLQAEAALRVSDFVINATAEMISVVDEHNVYRLVNDAWCRVTGLNREQVLGRRSMDVLPGAVTMQRQQAAERSLRLRQRVTVRDRVTIDHMPVRHVHTEFMPIAEVQGSGPMVALTSRDVTVEEVQREALAAAAEVLRGTLDATGDALFATDADPTQLDQPVRYANAQLFQLFGLPEAWRPTPTLRQLTEGIDRHLVDTPEHHRIVRAIIDGQAPPQDQITLRDGRVLLRRYASVPMGGSRLRVWSFRDISIEFQAVQAREAVAAERQSLLDLYPGFIAAVDQHDRYVYVNHRLAKRVQRTAESMIGRRLDEVLGTDMALTVRQHLQQARLDGRAVSESRFAAIDERGPLDLEVTHIAGPRQDDGSQRVYAFGADITERKRAQQALTAALAEAERANRTKSQFLSRMSHELRTPLNAVLGFGQLLQMQPMSAGQQQHVSEILRGGRHLLALINDLLDLGRIEAGELDLAFEAVVAEAAIADGLSLLHPLARERGITLQQALPARPGGCAWADPKRLRQVLLNLLSNAIKYNRPGGRVDVDCVVLDDALEFRCHDTGPGLTLDEQQRLFHPFERLDAARTAVDGTGIGLAISRSLVEAMGGHIGVNSTPGQGSTFWFRLPRADGTQGAAQRPSQPIGARATRRLHALYIEDNLVNQLLLTAMLTGELDLDTAADPFEGLDKAFARPPDLVLLDIQLPGIDGFEVLRRLRADARTRRVPVVAVSANAMPADLDAGRAAGFAAYLTKPVERDELLTTVRRVTAPGS